MNKEKGFTLIELMVVIAIIGVLTAMIILGWRTYQDRADDISIVNTMNQLASFSESIRVRDGDYSAVSTEPQFTELEDSLPLEPSTINFVTGTDDLGRADRAYCASTTMLDGGSYYCVDSEFNSGRFATDPCDTGLVCQ